MDVGFTGTRRGLTDPQRWMLEVTLSKAAERFEALHHGDCVGADEVAHQIALKYGMPVVIHPPENTKLRAWCQRAAKIHDAQPYLERNRSIVRETDWLIACPDTEHEVTRSGTWSTVRFARGLHSRILIILPSGEIK